MQGEVLKLNCQPTSKKIVNPSMLMLEAKVRVRSRLDHSSTNMVQ